MSNFIGSSFNQISNDQVTNNETNIPVGTNAGTEIVKCVEIMKKQIKKIKNKYKELKHTYDKIYTSNEIIQLMKNGEKTYEL